MKRLLYLFSVICLSSQIWAQTPLENKLLSDLKAAQSRLSAQRAQQAEERRALSAKITKDQNDLIEKRRLANMSRRSIADQKAYLSGLKNKDYASSNVVATLSEGLRTYGVKLSTRFLPGEPNDSRLDSVFGKSTDANTDVKKRLEALELGLERIEQALGGSTVPAKVSTDDATFLKGKVMSFGPVQWFQADDKSAAGGYSLSRSGQVATLDTTTADIANSLFAGEEVEAPIDITGGKARALAKIKSGPIELMKKGGAWVYPIILLAIAALFCAIRKFLELKSIGSPRDVDILKLAQQHNAGDSPAAESGSRDIQHPVADVLPPMIQVLGGGAFELAEEVLYERLIPVREKLRRWLPFLAVTAAIAPLLGLLGTVSGLIKTFSVIAIEGTGEAQSISGGISEALVTTLFGLTVAIPAFMAHALLSRRAKGIEQSSERLALVFLNEVRKAQTRTKA